MAEIWIAVCGKIVAMFLVMMAGWLARRRGWFTDQAANASGRFVIDIAFPALTFSQMLKTVDSGTLRASVPLLLTAIGLLAFTYFAAYAASFLAPRAHRPSFTFLGGMPNWIFLPLAIVPSVVGDAGVRVVLLFNIPAQVFMWTVGVWVLRGGFRGAHSFQHLLTNPGLLATLAGILIAVLVPGVNEIRAPAWDSLRTALEMLGALTVPLSLVVTGAQLGAMRITGGWTRELGALLGIRLIAAPLLSFAAIRAFAPLDDAAARVVMIIAAMPIGVSCAMFIERFGGDRELAARSIALSTLFSLLTLPLLLWIVL